MFIGQLLQQSLASIFQQVKHVLESLRATVVRVGDSIRYLELAEVGHTDNLLLGLYTGGTLAERIDVPVVHTDNQVEVKEVGGPDRTRQMRDGVASAGCMGPHAGVCHFSLVIVNESGRVGDEFSFSPGLSYQGVHDGFRRGRAADIAEAHEKDALLRLLSQFIK